MPIKGHTFSNISHSHFDGHTTLRFVFLSIRIGRPPWPREHNLCNSDVYKLEFLGIWSECKDINAYGFSVRLSQIPQANSHTSGILNPSRVNMYALTQMPSRAPRIPHLLALLVRDASWKSSVTCVLSSWSRFFLTDHQFYLSLSLVQLSLVRSDLSWSWSFG